MPLAARRESGSNRVNRGGSWNNNARNVRSANRNNNAPTNRNNNLGFRPASSEQLSQNALVYGRARRARSDQPLRACADSMSDEDDSAPGP